MQDCLASTDCLLKSHLAPFFNRTVYRVSSGYHGSSLQEMPRQMDHVSVYPFCVFFTLNASLLASYVLVCY